MATDDVPATTVNGDRPKEHLADDRLGYAPFARAVAKAIARAPSSDGLVMAIHGPWGSGKTSAVNMIVEALPDAPGGSGVIVVPYNPWWFSEQDDLTRAFFAEVLAVLDPQVSTEIRDGFRKVARRLSSARKFIGAGVAAIPVVGGLKDLVEGGLEALGDAAEGGESLHKIRSDLKTALRKEGKKIVVIIDDVDRLPADEARQIFRLVKSVADLPNIIYLLVFDREIARRALEMPSSPSGPEWLEKIVQVSFDLPPIQPTDLITLFTTGLSEVAGEGVHVDEVRWPNIFHRAIRPWLRTPRDVARLLNAVATTWSVIADEVDFADFVALESIRLFEPAAYSLIRQGDDYLPGVNHERPRDKTWYDGLLLAISEPRREQAKTALMELFPRLASIWGNTFYQGDYINRWDKARRVCAPRRFPAYFTFAIGPDVFSRTELSEALALLGSPSRFNDLVEKLGAERRPNGDTRASVLLSELGSYSDDNGPPAVAVATLLAMGDAFVPTLDDGGGGFASIPMGWRVNWAVEDFLKRLPMEQRISALLTAVDTSLSIETVGGIISDAIREHDPDNDRAPAMDERLLDPKSIKKLRAHWKKRLAKLAADGSLIISGNLARVLYRWAGIADDVTVKKWTDEQLDNDDAVVRLAVAVTNVKTVQSIGDVASRKIPYVDRSASEKIVAVDRLIERAKEVRETSALPPTSSAFLDRFITAAARTSDED